MTRKEFIGGAAAFAAVPAFAKNPSEIRAVLLHMGMNMWGEWRAPNEPKVEGKRYTRDEIFFSEDVWKRTIDHAKAKKFNMVVMDLGEFVSYPSHPELAVKILQPITSFDVISNWIKYHHERVDGTGYYHLKNEQIPLASRLIAVADTYSAMTMERSYRATMPHEVAIMELRRAAGTQLDPEIVNIFCQIPYKKIEMSMAEVRKAMGRYEDGDFRVRTGDVVQ